MNKKTSLIVGILLITVFLTSCLSSQDVKSDDKLLSVSASGEVTLSPDIVTFTVQVNETEQTTSEALNLTNKKISKVLEILYSYNIEEKDVATNSINLNPQYVWEDGNRILTGQSATQSLSVKLRNVNNLGKIIDELSKITNINLYSINFDKEDKTEAYEKARIKAVKNALDKAKVLANAANMEIVEPISISEGSAPAALSYDRSVNAKFMVAESASYSTQTPTGELTITTTVNIIFTME